MASFDNDYGLLTGLAEGIKSGMGAYRDQKKRNEELEQIAEDRALKKRRFQADLVGKGLIETEGGGFEADPNSPFTQKGLVDLDYKRAGIGKMTAETNAFNSLVPQKEGAFQAGLIDKGLVFDPTTGKVAIDYSNPETQKKQAEIARINAQTNAANRKGQGAPKMAPEIKKQVDVLAGKRAGLASAEVQFQQYINQMKDPKLDRGRKLQAAQQAAKLINDPVNSDAVGSSELERIQAYLSAGPNWVKGAKLGPDIEGFTKSLEDNMQRIRGAQAGFQTKIDELKGGSSTSKGLIGADGGGEKFPRDVRNSKGQKATVQNAQELKEAMEAGFR